jgi:hypothetical protein
MKRVVINAYQTGLVFERGVYKQMLREGKYWFWNKQVQIYDLTQSNTMNWYWNLRTG